MNRLKVRGLGYVEEAFFYRISERAALVLVRWC